MEAENKTTETEAPKPSHSIYQIRVSQKQVQELEKKLTYFFSKKKWSAGQVVLALDAISNKIKSTYNIGYATPEEVQDNEKNKSVQTNAQTITEPEQIQQQN